MKGIMSYMQCANNVACYTLTATERYSTEFAKAQEIAKNEQLNGFLPVKKNGIITQPAAIAQNALLQIDQLGTQLIMNAAPADGAGAYAQIAGGATMSIAARTLNYSISNEQGKAAIASKNDEFPFSIGYSNIGGLNFSAGGVKVNTGAAAFNAQTMLGNTCSSAGLVVDGSGAAGVAVQGRKGTCIPASNSSVQGPSASAKAPSATIDGSTAGGQTVSAQ